MNMKSPLLAVLACLPLLAQAQAQQSRYWSVHGGMNNLSSWPAKVNFGGPSVDASLQIERGMQFGAVLGKQYGKARYDLEYQYGGFDITGAKVAAVSQAADVRGSYHVLTANAYRSVPQGQALALYGGLGLGAGRVTLPALGGAGGCQCLNEASKGSFVYQARLGMEYRTGASGLAFLQAGWLRLPGARSDGVAHVAYPRRSFATLGIGYRGLFN